MDRDFDEERRRAAVPGRGPVDAAAGPGTPGRRTGVTTPPTVAPAATPGASPDVQVGQRFGTARVVGHQVVMLPATAIPGAPGSAAMLPHDKFLVELADGRQLRVIIPQTPAGGIPWGYNPMTDAQVNERLAMLRNIGATDPRLFTGTRELVVATHDTLIVDGRAVRASGYFTSATGQMAITPGGLHAGAHGDINAILRHEGGHGVGYRLAPGVGHTSGFEQAFLADGSRSTSYALGQGSRDRMLREAYAEAHRLYAADPAQFHTQYPHQARIIERDLQQLTREIGAGRVVGNLPPDAAPRGGTAPAGAARGGGGASDPMRAPDAGEPARAPGAAPSEGGARGGVRAATTRVVGRGAGMIVRGAMSGPALALEIMLSPTSTGGTRLQRPDIPDQVEIEAHAREMVEADPDLSYTEACIRAAAQRRRQLPASFIAELRQEERDLADAHARAVAERIRREQQRMNWRNRGRNAPGHAPEPPAGDGDQSTSR
jgi:hypothetical protein